MEISISLPDEDIRFLDAYAAAQGLPSRSAALHKAVRLLRASGLGAAYAAAWQEWEEDEQLWDVSSSDGIRSVRRGEI